MHVPGSVTASCVGKNTHQSLGKGALKHFHSHLKDSRCVGNIKQTLLDYAKKNGMMELMKKRGYVRTQVVVAQFESNTSAIYIYYFCQQLHMFQLWKIKIVQISQYSRNAYMNIIEHQLLWYWIAMIDVAFF